MLWRALLAAIALSCTFSREITAQVPDQDAARLVQIKDVVCVLMLGGLQKEDLDANTLEKLRRHNVNMYDMNNENLRQECLLKSLLDMKSKHTQEDHELSENQNSTLVVPLNKKPDSGWLNIAEVQKSETAKFKDNIINIMNFTNQPQEIKTSNFIQKTHTDSEIENKQNLTQDKEQKGPNIKYFTNQSLESVMKFWSKFTRKDRTQPTTKAVVTTPYAEKETETSTLSKIRRDNKGYVHSKETDYINRIIAEYLASKTVPTTTQVVTTIMEDNVLFSNKIKQFLARSENQDMSSGTALQNFKNALLDKSIAQEIDQKNLLQNLKANILVKSETTELNLTTLLQNTEDIINQNTRRSINLSEFNRLIQLNSVTTEKTLHIPEQVTSLSNNQQRYIYHTELNFSPKLLAVNDEKQQTLARTIYEGIDYKKRALKYLDDMLSLHKELNTQPSIINSETIQNVRNNNERYDLKDGLKDIGHNTEDSNDTVKNHNSRRDMVIQNKRSAQQNRVIEDPNKNIELQSEVKEPVSNISPEVIQAIAEKVKAIVMKDIKKEIPTIGARSSPVTMSFIPSTTVETNSVTSSATNATVLAASVASSTIPTTVITSTTTDKPTTIKDAIERNIVLKTLVKMFKDLNIIKETTTAATDVPSTTALNEETTASLNTSSASLHYLPSMNKFSSYNRGTSVSSTKALNAKPYSKLVPIPLGPTDKALQNVPHIPQRNVYQKIEYRPFPVMFQTNSAEIRPLAIEIQKPSVINQHILVTTQNPFEKQKGEELDRKSKQRFEKLSELVGKKNKTINIKEMYFADAKEITEREKNEYKDFLKNRIQLLNDRLKYAQDPQDYKVSELDRPIDSGHQPVSNIVGLNQGQPVDLIYRDTLSRLLDSNLREYYNRPDVLTNHDTRYRPVSSNRGILNRPVEINHREIQNRLKYKDLLTPNVLNDLVNSDHRDLIIGRLTKYPTLDAIHRPVAFNHQNSDRYSDAYNDRQRPLYRGPKFHEKLERMDLNRNNYNALGKMTTEDCCDVIAARQQKPLSRIKQGSKFDDTHFRNFLESQQKVTEMLERILATKTRSGPRSVETT